MTKKEMIKTINQCIKHYKRIRKFEDQCDSVFGTDPEAPLFIILYTNFDDYVDIVSKYIGDKNEWLPWYIWDNDCGKNEMGCKTKSWDICSPIRNTKDLAELIIEDK